jgi:pyruvate dehydrogenase E2 component (dihydrolipoamide acetyltransferase)/2-oxoisovalerate dehydrogenase E2 component (dihydrolipoyl transacylase)
VLHDRYDIGFAVATDRGLLVPVIRNVDQLPIGQVAQRLQQLAAQARDQTIRRADLTGATFVVTSVGGIGGLISTPIINQPNVAILGLGRVVRRPVYDQQGRLRPADMMYLSFSFDHRVLDGAVGARFGNDIIRRLQQPAAWLIPL